MADPARRLVALSVRHPRWVLAAAFLLAVVFAPGIRSLRIETATESVLAKGSPGWQEYQRFQHEFGSDEYVALLLKGDQPLRRADLEEVAALSKRIGALKGVDRVDSLSTVPALLLDRSGSLLTSPMIGDDSRGLEHLERLLRRHRTAENWLVSRDRTSYGINAVIEMPVEHHYPGVLAAVGAEAERRTVAASGVPIFRAAADGRMRSDLVWYVPVTVMVVGALVFLFTGSLGSVVAALLGPGLAVWLTLGAMGVAGVPLSITTVVIPPVVLALGCAYAMHSLCAISGEPGAFHGACLEGVAKPIAMSGMTTAIGFLGLAAVRIEAINVLGIFGAFSVAVLTLGTLSLAPAAISLLGVCVRRRPWDSWVLRSAMTVWSVSERRPVVTAGVWAALFAIGLVAAVRVDVSTNVIGWFGQNEPVRADYELIRQELAGITPLAVVLQAREGAPAVTAPSSLRHMRSFLGDMRSADGVGHAIGLSDLLGQLHAELGSSTCEVIDRSAEVEQLLLLIGGEPILNSLLSDDRRSAAVLLRLNDNDSRFIRDLAADAKGWWTSRDGSGLDATVTGVMLEFARSQDEIVYGQVRGLTVALAAIALVVLVAFRSFFLASVCLLINVLPLLLAVGFLWLIGASMDAATAVITCLTLGIAVDDSLHLIFQRDKERRSGVAAKEAGGRALGVVARPVVFSTATVVAGFAILGASGFLPVANLGLVTAGAMVACMLADLSLMPALLAVESE